jgi:hypothetical protein
LTTDLVVIKQLVTHLVLVVIKQFLTDLCG